MGLKVLHLSDTPLSGAPLRLSKLLAKYGEIESRHMVWKEKLGYREYGADISGQTADRELLHYLIYEWADILHFHNRYARQEVFKALGTPPPAKPSVIQMHSPRDSEDFSEEVRSAIPIAVIAQYHVRQWPEAKFLVPNAVDIYHRDYLPTTASKAIRFGKTKAPVVSYAPSNTNMPGWNDKSYGIVAPVLKRMRLAGIIDYQLICKAPFDDVMIKKKQADIGIDEVSTGSYHLSSLEYLSLGVGCFANIDPLTEKAIKDVTGAAAIPWIRANKDSFERVLRNILKERSWPEIGDASRSWMEEYWNPRILCSHYLKMYQSLE